MLQRLKSREEFTQALKTPVVARTVHFVLHGQRAPVVMAEGQNHGQARTVDSANAHSIGCVLPKRWAKRAVTRNLLRRLIWATAGEQLPSAKTGIYVVRLRAVVNSQSHPSASSQALRREIRQELQALFAQTAHTIPRNSA